VIDNMSPCPIVLLTGFLGAGKTTLLNALLRDPAFADTAVLINEFGEVAIDHDLIAEFGDDGLVTTTTGCLCCEVSSDIKESLFDLRSLRREGKIRPFRRVIVETTGLVDPVPVLNALLAPPRQARIDRVVSAEFALTRVVTLFDAVTGGAAIEQHFEALKQIALADAVVLTKTDLAHDPATLSDVKAERARLQALNPGAPILDRHADWPTIRELFLSSGTYDLRTKGEDALAWLKAEALAGSHPHVHGDAVQRGDGVSSHCLVIDEPIPPVVLDFFLDALKIGAGPDLLRIKGLVALSDDPERPVVLHGVQHLIHPIGRLDRWPSADKRTRIVLIGCNLNVAAMRNLLTPKARPRAPRSARSLKGGLAAALGATALALGASWLGRHPTAERPATSMVHQSDPGERP
jgi:G3E family GTPase